MTYNTKIRWGVTVICLIAFLLIALLADQIFEHVPHSEDEVAYIFQAKVFAQNRLAIPVSAYDQAFWTPFVVTYNGLRFGKYAPGWPFLLSLGYRMEAPWLINALLGTLTLALLARLGRSFYRPSTGLWAAGLGLVTPGFLFLSASFLSHAASLFWATVTLLALFHLTETHSAPRKRWGAPPFYAVITGAALGCLFVTRPFAGLGIGLPVGLFILILMLRKEVKWHVLPWFLLGGGAIALLYPLYWWAITGTPTFNAYLLVWPYDRVGFGPDIGPLGYTLADALFSNTRLKLQMLAVGLFGWPGWSSLLFLPIPFLARQAQRWDWLLLGTVAGVVGVHIFYWAFGGVDGGFPRYYYDALPALLLLTARGIQISIAILARLRPQLAWLPVGLIGLFIIYSLTWRLPFLLAAQKGKYDITPLPVQIVEQANLPKPALVIIKNVGLWSDFAAPFVANSPTLDGPILYAIDWGPEFNQQLRREFAERTCWELEQEQLRPCP